MINKKQKYTSNLQKAGAAVEDIKILLKNWKNDIPQNKLVKELITKNILGKKSRKRTTDVIRYIFLPRYVNGFPEGHWVYLKKFIKADISRDILRLILYFYCALNEPLIKDFIEKILLPRYRKGILEVDSQDVYSFINHGIEDKSIPVQWSESVSKRVASGLFAALKEFGILEGGRRRKISPKFIPLPVFIYIALFISKEGAVGKKIIHHDYWSLFLLNQVEITHLFMEAHQQKYLHYEEVGNIVRIDFFYNTFEELVNVIIERAN
jgi:hypothetical protein